MIKSLAPLATLAFLGSCAIALPLFAPDVKANETLALPRADRLAVHAFVRDCADQVWPDFDASCLRDVRSDMGVRDARLVAARR